MSREPMPSGDLEALEQMLSDTCDELNRVTAERDDMRETLTWIDTWVSSPATAYSVDAIEGLFSQARERLAAISKATGEAS